MVQVMLEGMGGDWRRRRGVAGEVPMPGDALGIKCYHVNARVSRNLEDVGGLRVGKLFPLLGHCIQAVWCRFRYGVENFYYVPAPGKRSALYRDWVVLLLCRPFFKRLILHWHASGLAQWLETSMPARGRSITHWLMKGAELSIVPSNYGRPDAQAFHPRRIAVVANGIADPCADFATRVLPRRLARLEARRFLSSGRVAPPGVLAAAGTEPHVFKALFLGHCTREKGLFEAVEGTLAARKKLAAGKSALELRLVVAGQFVQAAEEEEFKRLSQSAEPGAIEHIGFVSGEAKRRCFEEADGFCFPSHIESFGLVLLEAMAFGLPIVAARRGAMPEVLPANYAGLVASGDAEGVGERLIEIITADSFEALRERFEGCFTLEKHLEKLAEALRAVED